MDVNNIPSSTPGTMDPKTCENIVEIHRSRGRNIMIKNYQRMYLFSYRVHQDCIKSQQ